MRTKVDHVRLRHDTAGHGRLALEVHHRAGQTHVPRVALWWKGGIVISERLNTLMHRLNI